MILNFKYKNYEILSKIKLFFFQNLIKKTALLRRRCLLN
jgi:hypothetical protein